MEIEGVPTLSQPIVDHQGDHQDRTVGAIGRECASRLWIGDMQRNVAEVPEVGIRNDGVAVVEVKGIFEAVRIRRDDCGEQ
jgi:hypothetical protein